MLSEEEAESKEEAEYEREKAEKPGELIKKDKISTVTVEAAILHKHGMVHAAGTGMAEGIYKCADAVTMGSRRL